MHDVDAMVRSARMLRRAGAGDIVAALTFTLSPVHDDEFYASIAEMVHDCPDIDRAYLKDPTGLLSPERAAR